MSKQDNTLIKFIVTKKEIHKSKHFSNILVSSRLHPSEEMTAVGLRRDQETVLAFGLTKTRDLSAHSKGFILVVRI